MSSKPVCTSILEGDCARLPETKQELHSGSRPYSEPINFLINQIHMAVSNSCLDDALLARKIFQSLKSTDELPQNVVLFFQKHKDSDPVILFHGLRKLYPE